MENHNKKGNNFNFILIVIVSIILGLTIGIVFNKSSTINQEINIDSNDKYKININVASVQELMTLPGVGKVKAVDIIEDRPYHNISELINVVGEKTFNSIKYKVVVK